MYFILDGILYGFHLISPDLILTPVEVTKYQPATSNDVHDKVEKQISEENQLENYLITKTNLPLSVPLEPSLNLTVIKFN